MHNAHVACVLDFQTSGGNSFPGCSGGTHAAYFSGSTTYTAPISRAKGEDFFITVTFRKWRFILFVASNDSIRHVFQGAKYTLRSYGLCPGY